MACDLSAMTIEVTSILEQRRRLSVRLAHVLSSIFKPTDNLSVRELITRTVGGLLILAAVAGADSLVRSYKYYSRLIDARLASGYLTSRPGIYAAPRSIRSGQKLSIENITGLLRRAGYVQVSNNDVWSGTFAATNKSVTIKPARSKKGAPSVVRIYFENNAVTAVAGDDLPLESFQLEPEVLSNDLSSKGGEREPLTFAEIPPVLVHAILSIEDRRFFEHSGVDVFGVGRALWHNANEDNQAQGGSTITQQLIKNTYLTPERTLQRKYAEAMLAVALERRLSKQEIFALYCNEVYLGQRGAVIARGVKEASDLYFGKALSDLTLAEASTLAGMIQGPSHYSPIRSPEAARARRNQVLAAMSRDGWIDIEQAAASATEPVAIAGTTSSRSVAPYFTDFVQRVAAEQLNENADGRRLYTTIDTELQLLAERAIENQLNRIRGQKPQAALVALDPKTGNVLAMVGGRDYGESQLNRATDARRQPGSTFKPFVYAAAIEDGMSPVQRFSDSPREFIYDRNKKYTPSNFRDAYSMREVPMRNGLVSSLNVVTVDVALQTGLARIANLSESFGLPRPERYPSLALGTKEVTPLELAAAYAAFVNGGRRVTPRVIASIDEPPATHAAQLEQPEVISPTTAYMITNMLSAVIDHGTARTARGVSRFTAVAGKTGTSRDGWFVGYTPNLVCVVWIGFDDNSQLGITGAEAALPAWVNFIEAVVKSRPEYGGRNFECPEGIKFVEIDSDEGALSTLSCPHRELIAVTEQLSPHVECFRHGIFLVPLDSKSHSASHEKARPSPMLTLSTRSPTAILIDASGRATLRNDLP